MLHVFALAAIIQAVVCKSTVFGTRKQEHIFVAPWPAGHLETVDSELWHCRTSRACNSHAA